jgi:hypothetical protein
VKECSSILHAAEILCPEISSFLKLSVFFSENAVADRANDLAGDTQRQLKEKCEEGGSCSVAVYGSADGTAIVLLSGFVQGVRSIRTSC